MQAILGGIRAHSQQPDLVGRAGRCADRARRRPPVAAARCSHFNRRGGSRPSIPRRRSSWGSPMCGRAISPAARPLWAKALSLSPGGGRAIGATSRCGWRCWTGIWRRSGAEGEEARATSRDVPPSAGSVKSSERSGCTSAASQAAAKLRVRASAKRKRACVVGVQPSLRCSSASVVHRRGFSGQQIERWRVCAATGVAPASLGSQRCGGSAIAEARSLLPATRPHSGSRT